MQTDESVDFEKFFLGLPEEERAAFATAAGTTAEYLQYHLLEGRRMPRAKLIGGIAKALTARSAPVDVGGLASFFYARSTRESVG